MALSAAITRLIDERRAILLARVDAVEQLDVDGWYELELAHEEMLVLHELLSMVAVAQIAARLGETS